MKIGIITLHLHSNIGGILQAWALQTALGRMGHKVEVIDTVQRLPPLPKDILRSCYHILRKLAGRKGGIALPNRYKTEATNKFTATHINLTGSRNFSSIKQEEYGAFVVGSDQIWRPGYNTSNLMHSYLDFAETWNGVRRVAYAASFGVDKWEYNDEQTAECARLVKKFDIVTVREDSAVRLCEEHLHVKALHVLDPTMLLDIEDYERLIAEDETKPGSDIFCYILDENADKRGVAKHMAKVTGQKTCQIEGAFRPYNIFKKGVIQYPSVPQWLRCFKDAKCVITDSFHGSVFSIIFNKPFIVLQNEGRGNARMESLLRSFDLEERLVNPSDFTKIEELLHKPLDTAEKMGRLRSLSMEALSTGLGK